MLPLVGRPAYRQAVLCPDAHAAQVEAGLLEGSSEVDPFHVRMEHIGTAAFGHVRSHVPERREQEIEELFILHAVVLDAFSVCGFIRHIVGRVRHHEVCLHVAHEPRYIFLVGAVAAHHGVPADFPDVPALYERSDGLRIGFALVILDFLVMHLTEQIIHLSHVEAGRRHVIAGQLQFLQQVGQGGRLPITGRLVQRNVQGFLILRVFDMNHHTVHFRRAFVHQHLVALVAPDDVASHLIPDDGVYIPKVMQAALDLFIGRVSRLQIFAGVVFRGLQLIHRKPLHLQLCFHAHLLYSLTISSKEKVWPPRRTDTSSLVSTRSIYLCTMTEAYRSSSSIM